MSESADKTAGSGSEKARKPGLTLIAVLVALIVLGVMAGLFAPKMVWPQLETDRERAFAGIVDELANRDQYGWTPLHSAGNKDAVEVLHAKDADDNLKE